MNTIELLPALIKSVITSDSELSEMINDIFPLDAIKGSQYPYISFSISNIIPTYSKDGLAYDSASVTLGVADKDYDNMCLIANKLRNLFECHKYSVEGLTIRGIALNGVSEFYDDGAAAFGKRITLDIRQITEN